MTAQITAMTKASTDIRRERASVIMATPLVLSRGARMPAAAGPGLRHDQGTLTLTPPPAFVNGLRNATVSPRSGCPGRHVGVGGTGRAAAGAPHDQTRKSNDGWAGGSAPAEAGF